MLSPASLGRLPEAFGKVPEPFGKSPEPSGRLPEWLGCLPEQQILAVEWLGVRHARPEPRRFRSPEPTRSALTYRRFVLSGHQGCLGYIRKLCPDTEMPDRARRPYDKEKTDNTPEILRAECLWQAASCHSHRKCRSCKGFILSVRNGMPAEARAVGLPARLVLRPG